MRNLFQLLCLVSLIFITSCKKDEGPQGIEGEWSVKSISCADCLSLTTDGADVYALRYTMTGKDISIKVTLKDGNATSTGSYTSILEGDLDGLPYYQEIPFSKFEVNGTYVRNGNQMVVTNSSGTQNSTITDETPNSFTLTTSQNEVKVQGGLVIRITGTIVLKLERL